MKIRVEGDGEVTIDAASGVIDELTIDGPVRVTVLRGFASMPARSTTPEADGNSRNLREVRSVPPREPPSTT